MAFSLFHTITVDGTSSSTEYTDALAALDYFHGTFLPSCSNTGTSTDGGSKRGFRLPAYDMRNANTLWQMRNWYTRPADGGSSTINITLYEDATYTTTPGDLLNDATCYRNMVWHDGSSLSYKFWKSDTATDSWFVTRGANIIIGWYAPNVPIDRPTTAALVPSTTDQRELHMFPVINNTWYFTNWPITSNNTSSSYTTYTTLPAQNMQPEGPVLGRKWPIYWSTSSSMPPGYVDKNDIQYYLPDNSLRPNIDSWATVNFDNIHTSIFSKVLIDGTDWWLFGAAPTNSRGAIALYCGTTEPDLT